MFYCVYEAQKINVWQAMVKKCQIFKQNPFLSIMLKMYEAVKLFNYKSLVAKSKLIKEI